MNKVILMGRAVRDPEVRYSQGANATAVARFSIAVDRRFKRENEPSADFFNCTAFGKLAEIMEKYLKQGKQICISGRVENDNYTDKNGNKVYGTRILVEEMDFCGSKEDSPTNEQKTQNTAKSEAREGFMDIPDSVNEELPFN